MVDIPYSQIFDDIYFSRESGIDETRHVFLKNNALPESWAQKKQFTIAETGFGTGLNFLVAWAAFEETASPGAVLDYVSFELYPLTAEEIGAALGDWRGAFGDRLDRLVKHYPLRIPGWHRIDFGRVRLTLIFDDVNDAIPRLNIPRGVDAWFLDGFAPSKNPGMWTPVLFSNMARLSHTGTTLASFTAAGLVKNGLREAGFTIEKVRGYGRKRDMITGRFNGSQAQLEPVRPQRVAIIGGGLAGTACAQVLRYRGISHTIFEAAPALAGGASGNPGGIFNPRFTAHRNAQSDFYAGAYALAARTLRETSGVGFAPCGSLHLITDDDKRRRFESCLETWRWPEQHMKLLDAAEASQVAGISLPHSALYLPDSGQVSPHLLCTNWAAGSDVKLNAPFSPDNAGEYDAVIYACAAGASEFMPDLPLQSVRGQIIAAETSPATSALKTNLCYSGYIGAPHEGRHIIGSTFQKWIATTDLREEDNAEILARLNEAVPGMIPGPVAGARAALRCAAQDRFPVIGAVPGTKNSYVTTAHGSHGIVSSLAGAHLIADLMDGGVQSLGGDTIAALSPQRFLDRAQRRGAIIS
ncbi:MAG: 5-methylaminomethyl-2-thiouridine-forming enzyme mnmC [Micavibrio sp.]|nr:5-methylaminomethyl-2-thiouridine-forming enzyme mnmC [Micavibrio sp.]